MIVTEKVGTQLYLYLNKYASSCTETELVGLSKQNNEIFNVLWDRARYFSTNNPVYSCDI